MGPWKEFHVDRAALALRWPAGIVRRCQWKLTDLSAGRDLRPHPVVILLVYGNRALLAEVIQVDTIGLPGTHGRNRRDGRHAEGDRTDLERDVGRAGRRHGCEERRKQGSDGSPDILPDGHRRDPDLRLEEFGE